MQRVVEQNGGYIVQQLLVKMKKSVFYFYLKAKGTHTMEYYSSIKKEWNNAICSNLDEPRDYHTKWNKSDRERQISYDYHLYVESKKMIQMNLFTKQK